MLKINKNGTRFWRNTKGQFHREDGPAIEYRSGTKCWYMNDRLHRENGPAVECFNGDRRWWLNGKEYTEDEYKEKVVEIC